MATTRRPTLTPSSENGFTLVELMIALVLSSIVIGAAFALFINSNRVYQATSQTGRVQQEARAALDIIAFELQMAGFGTQDPLTIGNLGEGSEEDKINKDQEMAFTRQTIDQIAGPDTLQFQANLGGVAIIANTYENLPSTDIELNVNQGADGLLPGMSVIVVDAQRNRLGTAVFNGVTIDNPANPTSVRAALTAMAVPGNVQAGALIMKAPKFITYLLQNGHLMRCARNANGICDPTAYVNVLPDPAGGQPDPETTYALADHVVDLQFSYLLEGSTAFVPAPAADDFAGRLQIRAVKIELLVESRDENPTYSASTDCATLSTKGGVQTVFRLGNHTVKLPYPQCLRTHTAISTVVRLPNMYSSQNGT